MPSNPPRRRSPRGIRRFPLITQADARLQPGSRTRRVGTANPLVIQRSYEIDPERRSRAIQTARGGPPVPRTELAVLPADPGRVGDGAGHGGERDPGRLRHPEPHPAAWPARAGRSPAQPRRRWAREPAPRPARAARRRSRGRARGSPRAGSDVGARATRPGESTIRAGRSRVEARGIPRPTPRSAIVAAAGSAWLSAALRRAEAAARSRARRGGRSD